MLVLRMRPMNSWPISMSRNCRLRNLEMESGYIRIHVFSWRGIYFSLFFRSWLLGFSASWFLGFWASGLFGFCLSHPLHSQLLLALAFRILRAFWLLRPFIGFWIWLPASSASPPPYLNHHFFGHRGGTPPPNPPATV